MEISSVWFAGASALYNVEFYQLAKNNLTNEGIFQQWIQLHHISAYDLLSIISSVRYVFKNIRLFFGGNQGVIVASDLPLHIPFSRMQRFFKDKQFQNIQKISPYGNIFCLLGEELLDPEEINQYINYFKITLNSDIENFISTDDNLFLEYSTPKGNLKSYIHSLNKNVNLFLKFDRNPNNIVTNIPSKGWQLFINGCVALGGNKTQKGMDWLKEARELLPDEEQETLDRMIRHVMNTQKNE
jgi:spermidine synthase